MKNENEPWVLEIDDGSDRIKYLKANGKYVSFATEDAAQNAVDDYEEKYPQEARERSYTPVQMFFESEEYLIVGNDYKIPRPKLTNKQQDKIQKRASGSLCPRCDGEGVLLEYEHIEGGKCFACQGTGKKLTVNQRNDLIRQRSVANQSSSEGAVIEYRRDREGEHHYNANGKSQKRATANKSRLWILTGILLLLLAYVRQNFGTPN